MCAQRKLASLASILFAVLGSLGCRSSTPPSSVTPQAPNEQELKAWSVELSETPRPDQFQTMSSAPSMSSAPVTSAEPKPKCYAVEYPSREWHEVACKTPEPREPNRPRTGGEIKTHAIGGGLTGGKELIARAAKAPITSAQGSFDRSNVPSNVPLPTRFELQLNTDFVDTRAFGCEAKHHRTPPDTPVDCKGWEQFIYDNRGQSIQYWLVRWELTGSTAPCPQPSPEKGCSDGLVHADGWCPFDDGTFISCARLGPADRPLGSIALSSLSTMVVQGSASAAADSIAVLAAGFGASTPGGNYFPDLGGNLWREAEFNIYGHGDTPQVAFPAGTNFVVRTALDRASGVVPDCDPRGSFTFESNNLDLVITPPAANQRSMPALVFQEHVAVPGLPVSAPTCGSAKLLPAKPPPPPPACLSCDDPSACGLSDGCGHRCPPCSGDPTSDDTPCGAHRCRPGTTCCRNKGCCNDETEACQTTTGVCKPIFVIE
jgi:hypothetical protein